MGMRRTRMAMSLSVAAVLVVAGGGAAFRLAGAQPIASTMLTVKAGQSVGTLAVDVSSGHVYAVVSGPSSSSEMRVLDVAGNTHERTLVRANGWLQPVVAPGTGHVFVLRQAPNGQATRVDMLDAHRNTRLATIAVPLSPNYFPRDGDVAVRGGTVILGSPGNQVCTSTGSSAPQCTLTGDGVAVLDAV